MLKRLLIILSFNTLSYAANTVTITDDNILLVNGSPFFPLGVYFQLEQNQWHPNGYDELQNNGFNVINLAGETWGLLEANSKNVISSNEITQDPSFIYRGVDYRYSNPYMCYHILQLANDHNLMIMSDNAPFTPDGSLFGQYFYLSFQITQTLRENWVHNVKDWASNNGAFLGWFSYDEPIWDLHPYNETTLQNRYNLLKTMYDKAKQEDPNHIVYLNEACVHRTQYPPDNFLYEQARKKYIDDLNTFSQAADIISTEGYALMWYSTGQNPLLRLFDNPTISIIGDYTKLLVNDVIRDQKHKQVWMVLEAASRDGPGKMAGAQVYEGHVANTAYPYEFFRYEAYDAIVHGIPVTEICQQHQVSATQAYRWRDLFLESGKKALSDGRTKKGRDPVIKENRRLKELRPKKSLGRVKDRGEAYGYGPTHERTGFEPTAGTAGGRIIAQHLLSKEDIRK